MVVRIIGNTKADDDVIEKSGIGQGHITGTEIITGMKDQLILAWREIFTIEKRRRTAPIFIGNRAADPLCIGAQAVKIDQNARRRFSAGCIQYMRC